MSYTWQERAEYMMEERDALLVERARYRVALEAARVDLLSCARLFAELGQGNTSQWARESAHEAAVVLNPGQDR